MAHIERVRGEEGPEAEAWQHIAFDDLDEDGRQPGVECQAAT